MQSSIMETPPSESPTPGRVTSDLGASTQQDAHPLPEQINHMEMDRTSESSIASRFGTMLINTIQEEHTLGDSSIQSASGNLIDANTGDDGSARFFQEQEAFSKNNTQSKKDSDCSRTRPPKSFSPTSTTVTPSRWRRCNTQSSGSLILVPHVLSRSLITHDGDSLVCNHSEPHTASGWSIH